MQIEVKGRNLPVTDELRELAMRRFAKVDKQVSSLAVLEVEKHADAGRHQLLQRVRGFDRLASESRFPKTDKRDGHVIGDLRLRQSRLMAEVAVNDPVE